MSVPRVLLLTGVAPGDVNVGRLYLRDLCLAYPHDCIRCVHTEPLRPEHRSTALDWLPMEHVPVGLEQGAEWHQRLHRLQRMAREAYRDITTIPRLAERIARNARDWGADLIWSPLHAPTVIRLARRVAEAADRPLVTTVWDDPRYAMTHLYQLDRYTRRRVLTEFDIAMRTARRCGTASVPMKRRYEVNYSTECVVMVYGQQRPKAWADTSKPHGQRPFVIGFAGHIYTQVEWNALLHALAGRKWTLAGREIVIKVMSGTWQHSASIPLNLQFLGWRDTAETVQLLSQMDAAYLPYWFDEAFRDGVQLSFPGKLATYVAARLPVFYHGPKESSVSDFLQQYPVGLGCHSLEPEDMLATLERLVTEPQLTVQARSACDDAYRQELSADVFRRRFAELIGIGEDQLLPPPA